MNSNVVNNDLYHHGVKGMHWGIRRYQNNDGSPKQSTRNIAVGGAALASGTALTVAGGVAVKGIISGRGVRKTLKQTSMSAIKKIKAPEIDMGFMKKSLIGVNKTAKFIKNTSSVSYKSIKTVRSTKVGKGVTNLMLAGAVAGAVAKVVDNYEHHNRTHIYNNSKLYQVKYNASLKHYGVKGMHWGVRRYQNEDGNLTNAGRNRYNTGDIRNNPGVSIDKEKAKNIAKITGGAIAVSALAINHRFLTKMGASGVKKFLVTRAANVSYANMMSDKVNVIKKGKEISHVFRPDLNAKGKAEYTGFSRMYGTYLRKDSRKYAHTLPIKAQRGQKLGVRKAAHFKVNKDSKIMSNKKHTSMVNELMNRQDIVREISKIDGDKKKTRLIRKSLERANKTKNPNVRDYYRARAIQYHVAVNPNGYIANEYYKAVKSKGYDVVRDYIDHNTLGVDPVIVINNNILTKTGETVYDAKKRMKIHLIM